MASADIPEEQWAGAFAPEVVRERMRWVMEYDLLGELATYLAKVGAEEVEGKRVPDGKEGSAVTVL
jgi:salicylate hydroxylase